MIYEDETALIRRGLFEVQNEVGLGRHEEMYHKALVMWFTKENIPFVSKQPHPLLLNGETAHVLYPDFVVWNKITIELKSVPQRLQKAAHVQLFNYLICRNDKLGLLVNMGLDRVHTERFVYESQNCECVENWHYWNDSITGTDRDIGVQIRDVLQNIVEIHQTGYGAEVMKKLIHSGLKAKGLQVISSPVGESVYQGCELGKTPFDCLLIESRMLFVFTALFDDNQFNIHRGLSFMNALNISWGIAVNFGKRSIQIHGLAKNKSSTRPSPSVGPASPSAGPAFPSAGPSPSPSVGPAFPSAGPSPSPSVGPAFPSVGLSEQNIRGTALPSVEQITKGDTQWTTKPKK